MQVHRSKGVTTLKLTKRERDTLKSAWEILSFVGDLSIAGASECAAVSAEHLDLLITADYGAAEKETVVK